MDLDKTNEEEKTTTQEEQTTSNNDNITPSASGASAAKYPDMKLAQSIHQVTMMTKGKIDSTSMNELMEKVMKQVVEEMENPTLYRHLKTVFLSHDDDTNMADVTVASIVPDVSEMELAAMQEKNDKTMKELEEKVDEAKENAGDMEVLDATIEVARFAAKSLSKDEALDAYEKVLALPKLSSGKVMDALMESSRIASFYNALVKNTDLLQKVSYKSD